MAISQEQPPFEIDEALREYLIRFRTDVDNQFKAPPKCPERREMPYKPQVGDIHYFGDIGTHNYDAAITAEGFWGYSDPDGWRQMDTGGVEEAPIDGTTYGRNNGTWVSVAGGGGDVTGPAGATDNAIARYDGTTGKVIQDSTAIITDTGNLDISGSILVTGTVDGRDVGNDGTNLDNHIGDATIHFTEASIDHTAILNVGLNTHAQIDSHIADATIHFTEASIDHTAIQNIGTNSHAAIDTHIADGTIHFTEASIDHTAIQNIGINSHTAIDSHIADGTIHFSESSIDHTSIQNIGLNTHDQIDTHIADTSIHFTEASIDHINIQNVGLNTHDQIDTHIADTSIHFTEASIDHTAIQNVGLNTHDQIDTHIADASIHFTEASIDHTAIQNIGLNSHAAIDSHIADTSIHFTEASIDHTAILNVGLNTHAQIDTHIADGTIHFTEGSIDHLNIQNVGVNSHTAIDSHIADGTIHFTEGSIDHLNILNVGLNTHAQIDSHIADTTIHFTEASIDHTAIQNIGVNSHAAIDTHIADATIHFTEASIDHTAIQNVGTNTHTQIDAHIADTDIHYSDAPADGTDYVRNNNAWVAASGGGTSVSAIWKYSDTTTASDPGSGEFRLDNTTIASATALYISDETENGVDFSTILSVIKIGDELYLQNLEDATEAALVTISSITDNGTWWNFGITVNDTGAAATWTDGKEFGILFLINSQDTSNFVTVGAPDQTITSVKTFAPFADGVLGNDDIVVGDPTDYGLMGIGNATFGRTNFNAGALDLDGSMLSFNEALPATSNIEFAWADGTNNIRFALAVPGVGNATYNPRSMLVAGPAALDDSIVTVGYWQGQGIFDNLVCDTSGQGADFGVQNDLEVEGIIYTDNIQESTPAAAITLQANPGTVDGQMTWDGNQIALFPSDITFGEGYLFGWGPTGDPTTPFANRWNLNSASGFSFIMSNANFPQWIVGSTDPTSSWFIDGNGNKDIRFNTLDTGFDQDNVVHFGYGGIDLQDQGGDATFIRSAAAVAGTYTITLPDTDGDIGQLLVNTDGAATLDWIDPPATPVPGSFTESGSTNITQTAATIQLDTEELDPDGNYTLAAGEITVTEAGYYNIDYSIPVQQDTAGGATRGSIRGFIERDQASATFIEIAQSISRDYFREASGGAGVSGGCIVLLAAGEVIRLRAVISSTSDISSFPGEANLSIHRVRAA